MSSGHSAEFGQDAMKLKKIDEAKSRYIKELTQNLDWGTPKDVPGSAMLRMSATQDAPFEVDGVDYAQFLISDHDRRREYLRGISKPTPRQTEPYYKTVARDHIKFTNMLREDEDLNNGQWRFDYIRGKDSGQCRRFMGQRIRMTRIEKQLNLVKKLTTKEWAKGEKVEIPVVPIKSNFVNYLLHYKPPRVRIMITPNISWNKHTPIPVYCDVSETKDDLTVPPQLGFEYVDKIIVNAYVEPEVAKAIQWSERPHNHIKCDCFAKGLRCWKNKKCPCYQMNKRMQESQPKPRVQGRRTEFSSLKPILLNSAIDTFFHTFGFACSDLCSCEGKCCNNAMYLIEKNIFPLELYRGDMDMGFSVRCRVFIPAGTPVMTFTGELNESRNSPYSHNAYSFRVTSSKDETWHKVLEETEGFDEDYKKLLRLISMRRDYWVDPTHFGNVGRMVAHSCSPNMEIVRVYKKSLSPAHMNLVLVAVEDIYPGTPMSIDYGLEYAEDLKDCCKCESFACIQNPEREFMDLDSYNYALCIKKIHDLRHRNFELGVLDGLEKAQYEHGFGGEEDDDDEPMEE